MYGGLHGLLFETPNFSSVPVFSNMSLICMSCLRHWTVADVWLILWMWSVLVLDDLVFFSISCYSLIVCDILDEFLNLIPWNWCEYFMHPNGLMRCSFIVGRRLMLNSWVEYCIWNALSLERAYMKLEMRKTFERDRGSGWNRRYGVLIVMYECVLWTWCEMTSMIIDYIEAFDWFVLNCPIWVLCLDLLVLFLLLFILISEFVERFSQKVSSPVLWCIVKSTVFVFWALICATPSDVWYSLGAYYLFFLLPLRWVIHAWLFACDVYHLSADLVLKRNSDDRFELCGLD
jgi:hypothetical protein